MPASETAHLNDNDFPILPYASQTPPKRKRGLILLAATICVPIAIVGYFAGPTLLGRTHPSRVVTWGCGQCDEGGPIAMGLKMYNLHTGDYPRSLQALVVRPAGMSAWQGPYIEDAAKLIDLWGSQYQYRCPGHNASAYDLWSLGPDRQDGTEDDITSWPKQ